VLEDIPNDSGEALDSIYRFDHMMPVVADRGWNDIVQMLGWLCEHWDQPDEGIWETRGGRRPFMYGRIQSWVAFDRAIRMATERARPADIARWVAERDRLYHTVMHKGWNPKLKAFVQYEGSDVLDASTLLMLAVGMIVPTDEKWASTMSAMDKTLVSDSLVYRYDPKASPDGLRGSEGTFSLCTGWYVDALTRSGRLDDARLVFEKMLTYGNQLGLFSEEIGITGEQLGNFPQAFTHLSLINAASTSITIWTCGGPPSPPERRQVAESRLRTAARPARTASEIPRWELGFDSCPPSKAGCRNRPGNDHGGDPAYSRRMTRDACHAAGWSGQADRPRPRILPTLTKPHWREHSRPSRPQPHFSRPRW
jgi:pentatricopeptide repeat protein